MNLLSYSSDPILLGVQADLRAAKSYEVDEVEDPTGCERHTPIS